MPKDKFVEVGNARVRYWLQGASGSPVVLLHGIACSVLEWQHNIAPLAAQHQVYAVDLLGFGLSDKPVEEPYDLNSLARFVLKFMDSVGLSQAHLAGNSLGGRLALQCAALAPERVTSMVLVDPAGIDKRETLLEFRLTTLPVLGEMLGRPTAFGTRMLWRKAFFNPEPFVTNELVRTKVALASSPGALQAFLKTLRGFVEFGGFKAEWVEQLHRQLPEMRTRCLVIWGNDDQFVPVAHAQVLKTLMPNVQVEVFDHCGHVPQIECADRFNETVLNFWGQEA